MSNPASRFTRRYADARRKLYATAELLGRPIKSYPHPLKGPDGEDLAMDVVQLGEPEAKRIVVLTSGIHGPELFCGSGAQIDAILDLDPSLYPGVGFLVVHALNPFGTAWHRRVNEDNIDINRNFADFSKPLPRNPGYEELADAFVPNDSSPATLERASATLKAYGKKHGAAALRVATSGGQYTIPDGMFYGGTGPTWTRRTLEAIIRDYRLKERALVTALDFHAGAGPFGYCEPIYSGDPTHPGCDRLIRWIGPAMTMQRAGKSATPPQQGLSSELWEHGCGRHAAYVSFEYGTVPTPEVIESLRQEHILHRQGKNDWHDEGVQRVKRRLLDAFAPDAPEWREMVLLQARSLIDRVARGMAAERVG